MLKHVLHSPKFVFHERDDNLAICPILHVLALAFADDAFESEWINCPKDLCTFQIPSHLQSLPLRHSYPPIFAAHFPAAAPSPPYNA
jgi:hypothetical protein